MFRTRVWRGLQLPTTPSCVGGRVPGPRLWKLTLVLWACWTGVPLSAHDFTERAVLVRFDRNGDGVLSVDEQQRLTREFGGIDIPMLPDSPHDYLAPISKQARQITSWVQATDNTPDDTPLTNAGVALGRVLFYDRQLSANNKIACASCHEQARAFADPRRLSVGFEGGHTLRNAMALQNMSFTNVRGSRPGFFWDERAQTLEDQVLMPIQDPVEMGMSLPDLERKLQRLPYYPQLFQEAFGTSKVTSQRIARAVAQFMRALISFDSKFDQALVEAGGDASQEFESFTDEENFGKSLFIDGVGGVAEIGCAHCHVPPTFNMPKSFNNGLDRNYADRGLGAREVPSNDPFTPSNDGKFKSSSLRNIELTGPYMHDGRFDTLKEVVAHYSDHVQPHANLGLAFNDEQGSEGASGFRFSQRQQAALVAFLTTLTDRRFISDRRFSDPFLRPRSSQEHAKRTTP